jgi:hypothetical protein
VAEDLGKERLKILGEIGNLTQQINAFNKSGIQDEQRATELNKERLKLAKELRAVNEQIRNEQRQLYVDATNSVKGLGSLYDNLKKSEMKRIEMMRSAGDLSDIAVDRGNTLADLNQRIAQLTSDQSLEREILQDQFDAEIKKFEKQKGISEEIVNNLREQNQTARAYSDLTEGQKEQLEAQIAAYSGIKKAIGGVLDTASLLFKGPAGFFGSVLIGAGMFANKLGEVRSQLGGISDIGTTALSFIDDNAVENVKALSDEFGGIANVSAELQASTSLISTNMGISGTEAASLVGSFSRLNGNSTDVALDMTKTTQEFAKQNKIIPSKLMADLASSAEAFALFGKAGGKNILQAAGYAQKLGVNMNTITGLADNLLDFESSITKELELSALMGKNINLDRARALAYAGDLEGMTKETLKALGGQAAFNKMDYFSKKASADLLGVSVAELEKMVANQANANELGTTLAQKFSIVGESINAGMNKYLGVGLQGLGGMVTAMGQMNTGLKSIGLGFDGIGQKVGATLKKLLMWPINKIKGAFGMGGAKPEVPGADVAAGADKVSKGKGIGEQLKGLAAGLKEMGSAKVLFGALNLIPTGLGFVAILPGIPGMLAVSLLGTGAGLGLEFLGVGLTAMGNTKVTLGAANLALSAIGFTLMTAGAIGLAAIALGGVAAGAGLTALGVGLASFGATAPATLIGIGLLALLGLALIPLTFALSLLSPLVESIGTAIASVITSIATGISTIITSVSDLLVNVLPLLNLEAAFGILAIAGAFSMLAGSLAAVGVAGLAALPVLGAIGVASAVGGAIGGTISGLFGGEEGGATGGEGGEMSALLDEIKGLRADLNSGKVAVYLDGKKVTSTVARVANTSSVNTYAKR